MKTEQGTIRCVSGGNGDTALRKTTGRQGKKRCVFLLWLLCLWAGLLPPLPAFASDTVSTESRISTGGVAAGIRMETDEGAERLQPGAAALCRLLVTNQKERAWVRVVLETEGEDAVPGLWPLRFYGLSDEVIAKKGVLYSKRPLEKGELLKFCEGFWIPDLEEVPEELSFRIRAVPEALQDTGRVPDFEKDDPWEHMKVPDGETAALVRGGDGVFRLIAERGERRAEGKLFSAAEGLMPGETAEETVEIENRLSALLHVTLRLDRAQLSEEETALLRQMTLSVERNGRVLYQNGFLDDSLERSIGLGYLPAGTHRFRFRLTLPETLPSGFSGQSAKLLWRFGLHEDRSAGSSGGSGGAGSVTTERMYEEPDPYLKNGLKGGTWTLHDARTHRWTYRSAGGMQAKNGWLYLYNPYANGGSGENAWFKFNQDGFMEYGWIRSAGMNWYYCNGKSDGRLGSMEKGWHQSEEDQKWYYLDPVSGIMQTGWRVIDGKSYYFASLSDIPEQTWFYEAFDRTLGETAFGRWVYQKLGIRSYGSMYRDEATPDGAFAGTDGAKQDSWSGAFA